MNKRQRKKRLRRLSRWCEESYNWRMVKELLMDSVFQESYLYAWLLRQKNYKKGRVGRC